MDLYRIVAGPIQLGPGEVVSLDQQQHQARRHRVRVIETVGDRVICACSDLQDFRAGEVIGLPALLKRLVESLEAVGKAEDGKKPVADKSDERRARILAAIPKLKPGNRRHFRSDGAPAVAALEKLLGFDISEQERDAAWAVFAAAQEAPKKK